MTAGTLVIDGGLGADTLIGGSGTNDFDVGSGFDTMTCGSGANTFRYTSLGQTDSTSDGNIIGFNALTDSFQLRVENMQPNAIDAMVTHGALSSAHFTADLTADLGPSHLHAHDAVLFTPSGGNLDGHTFLVIDENGVAGYEAGYDLVIELTSATNLSQFSTADFT